MDFTQIKKTRKSYVGFTLTLLIGLMLAPSSIAATFSFATVGGSMDPKGVPIDITGFLTITTGDLKVSITNLDVPVTDIDAVYGITFQLTQSTKLTVATPIAPTTLTTKEATIASDGSYTLATAQVANSAWTLSSTGGTGNTTNLSFSVVSSGKPKDLVIGGPSGGGNYTPGSGWTSITQHNPYYFQTVTFDVAVPGLLANAVISSNVDLPNSLALQFGTAGAADYAVTLVDSAPEPDTLVFLGSGLVLIGLGTYRRKNLIGSRRQSGSELQGAK